jgi:hypothetical protein
MSNSYNNSKTEFGYVPSLALFEKPSVDSGIISYKWIQYRPVSQIKFQVVITFSLIYQEHLITM